MDTVFVKQAFDAFEEEDFMGSKEILQKQMHQAKNDFLKAKLELKNDIENQFANVEPEPKVEPEPVKKQRILARKKAGGE